MKFDKLYWKAFGAWCTCFTLFFGSVIDAIFVIGMFASGDSLLSNQALIMYTAGVVLATLPAAGAAGWGLSDVTNFNEPTRTLLLCESVKQGWRLTMLLNPLAWIVLFAWRYMVEPVWGCVWFVTHNTRIVDDDPRRQPLTEAERQVYAIGAVAVFLAIAAILKFRYFGH
jgi:hypothetical protein